MTFYSDGSTVRYRSYPERMKHIYVHKMSKHVNALLPLAFAITQILRQIYSVVFGLDVIGNPARLLNSFKVAAKDFISESRKVVCSPWHVPKVY